MLIAPTEPPAMKALGSVSSLPEQYGVDALFASRGQWVGIQRKELSDLINSVYDGRLTREVAQMQRLPLAMLIVEGRPSWTMDGDLMGKGASYGPKWTYTQHRGMLWSLRAKGIWVDTTDSVAETVGVIAMFIAYCRKEHHRALDRRPNPESVWGKPGNRDYACHLVQGLPGVGVELAERIVDTFGVPFGWKVSEDQLTMVEGIGKKKAHKIWQALETDGTGNGKEVAI